MDFTLLKVPFKINVKIKCRIKKTWNQGAENFCSHWHYIQKMNTALHSKYNLVYLLYVHAECHHLALSAAEGSHVFTAKFVRYFLNVSALHCWQKCCLMFTFSTILLLLLFRHIICKLVIHLFLGLHLTPTHHHHRHHHLDSNNNYNQVHVFEVMWLLLVDLKWNPHSWKHFTIVSCVTSTMILYWMQCIQNIHHPECCIVKQLVINQSSSFS